MRTTIDLEPDVLEAAREMAKLSQTTLGATVSRLVRKALTTPAAVSTTPVIRSGVPVFPSRGEIVTPEHVRNLEADE